MALLPLEDGDVFAERYRILRCIASGGMGAVYEAVHSVTERRCALKVMLSHTVERERLRERFMQESKLAAQIGSEFIVDVLDAGVDEKSKSPFLVMELLEGEDLGERLLHVGRFSAEETVRYLWDAARALDRTHQASIVHRDLKASNLFLTRREDGSPIVKVLDFGVAKVMPHEATSEGHTQTVGTPIYMAPEQFRAEGRVSPATDIYALGMLAFTLLVGAHYWKEEHDRCANPFAFASIAVHGPPEPPSVRAARRGVTLPTAFDDWFANATARKPGERFPSATEAVRELSEALGLNTDLPPATLGSGTFDPVSPVAVSRPRAAALPETVESASASLSSVASGGGFALSSGQVFPALPPPPRRSTTTGSSADVDLAPERTEVSLSVTSGGLSPVEEEAPPRGRSRWVIGLAAAAAAIAIAVGASGVLEFPAPPPASSADPVQSKPRVDTASTAREPTPSAEQTPPPPVATTAEETEPSVTSIDDLPTAPPAEQEARPQLITPRTRHAPRQSRAASTAVDEKTDPESSAAAPPTSTQTPAPPVTVRNREDLYGRD